MSDDYRDWPLSRRPRKLSDADLETIARDAEQHARVGNPTTIRALVNCTLDARRWARAWKRAAKDQSYVVGAKIRLLHALIVHNKDQAATIARLTAERDAALVKLSEVSHALGRGDAEIDRLRALVERYRAECQP